MNLVLLGGNVLTMAQRQTTSTPGGRYEAYSQGDGQAHHLHGGRDRVDGQVVTSEAVKELPLNRLYVLT